MRVSIPDRRGAATRRARAAAARPRPRRRAAPRRAARGARCGRSRAGGPRRGGRRRGGRIAAHQGRHLGVDVERRLAARLAPGRLGLDAAGGSPPRPPRCAAGLPALGPRVGLADRARTRPDRPGRTAARCRRRPPRRRRSPGSTPRSPRLQSRCPPGRTVWPHVATPTPSVVCAEPARPLPGPDRPCAALPCRNRGRHLPRCAGAVWLRQFASITVLDQRVNGVPLEESLTDESIGGRNKELSSGRFHAYRRAEGHAGDGA